jgi:hypothetical protein
MAVIGATHFYKYKAPPQDPKWLEDTIVGHQLYFPLPAELNDPVEARPRLDISRNETERFLYTQYCKEHPAASEGDRTQALNDIREGMALMGSDAIYDHMTRRAHDLYGRRRIFSLCKRWDSMSMWAKYAGDHSGYCLEFANAGLFAEAREVEYVDVVTENPASNVELGTFYFQKRREWSNEEEVRVLTRRNVPAVITIDPVLLTRIILGKDMTLDLRATIVHWAQERNPQLVVERAEYNIAAQALRLVPIEH